MCGIVAVFRRDGRPVAQNEIARMRDVLAHRGPDDSGLYVEGSVGLGMRRLEVIDLEGGHQPMSNRAGSLHLIYNGEIYNYRDLRRLLQSHGMELRTEGDTETILGLYELFGLDCVHYLHGMFAFVLWDSERRRLVAARDRLGIKPLYLFQDSGTVALASEIKAFLPLEEWTPEVASESVAHYLTYRSLPGIRTLFRGIRRVAPGELAVFSRDAMQCRRYWDLPVPTDREHNSRSVSDWTEELEELLGRVVREHLVSDVPLGTFNSGGVDSSLVTALAAGHSSGSLNTYSVGFSEPRYDESSYADLVAQRFNTHHHKLLVSEREYADSLPEAIWYHDEPLTHPHSVQLLHLSRLARQKVTVVLTGEGSDELFGGYNRYRLASLVDRIPLLTGWLGATLSLASMVRQPLKRLRIRTTLRADDGIHVEGLAAFVLPADVQAVLAGSVRRQAGAGSDAPVATPSAVLSQTLWWDQQNYLQSLLNRLDKMAMAASLEGRVPFLDHRVVELAARVPSTLKIRGLETKFLLKRLARQHLPSRIVNRRKAGFAVPVSRWLRSRGALSDYVDVLLEPHTLARGLFEPARLRHLVDQHRSGGRDHAELLWGLINLEIWQRTMIDSTTHKSRAHSANIPAAGA